MARDTAELEYSRWAGTISQLVEATRHAMVKVRELAPMPDGDEPSGKEERAAFSEAKRRAERAQEVRIVVKESGGFTGRPSLEEFANLNERSIEAATEISIDVGDAYMVPSVSIRLGGNHFTPLRATIEGFDRTWTAGIRHQLDDILKPRVRLHAPLLAHPEYVATPVGFGLFFLVVIGLDQLLYHAHKLTDGWRVVVSISAGLLVVGGLSFIVWTGEAGFELLAQNQPPRFQRWRKRAYSIAGTIIVGLVISAIWAVLQSS